MNQATQLFSLPDRELWLITSQAGEDRGGLIATFVCHASLPPELPRVLVAIAKHHFTWQLIESSGAFALHLLGDDQLELVWRFGLQSGRDTDKLAGLSLQSGPSGSPILTDARGWADCKVETSWDTGDRTVYLAEVLDAQVNHTSPPLTLKRLLQLAPADRLQIMRDQREQDSHLDAAAILAWRKDHHT